MANELRIKASIDAGDVGTGLQDIVAGITKIGTTASAVAGQSKNDWAALGQQLATIDPTLAGIGSTIIQIANASDRVGTAGAAGNVNQLERALLSAGVPMETLRSKMDAIKAASPEAAAKVQTFVDVANAGFETNATKLGTLKDAYDVVKAKMDAARAAASQLGTEGGAALGDLGTKGGTALDTLNAALDKMGSTTGIRGLQISIVQASQALDQFKAAGPGAGQSQADFAAQCSKSQAQIDASTKSLGGLKQTQLDVAASAKSSGSALENLRGSAGNLDTMFMNMSKTGNSVEKSIGSVGVAAGIMGMAITGAIAVGERLKQWTEDAYQAWDRYTKKQEDVAIKAQLLNAANIEVSKGLIEQGATVDQTIQRYVAFTVQQGKLSEQARAYITTVAGLKIPPTLDELKAKYDAVMLSVQGALARGGGAANVFYDTNKGAITSTITAYEEGGGRIDAATAHIIKSLDDARSEAAQYAADMKRSLDGVALAEVGGTAAGIALGGSVVALGEKYRNSIVDIEANKNAQINAVNDKLHALDMEGTKDDDYAAKRAAIENQTTKIVQDASVKEIQAKENFLTASEKVVAASGEEASSVAADVKLWIDRAAQTKQATADNAGLGDTFDRLSGRMKALGVEGAASVSAGLGKNELDVRNLTGVMDGLGTAVEKTAKGYVDSMGVLHSATVDEITDIQSEFTKTAMGFDVVKEKAKVVTEETSIYVQKFQDALKVAASDSVSATGALVADLSTSGAAIGTMMGTMSKSAGDCGKFYGTVASGFVEFLGLTEKATASVEQQSIRTEAALQRIIALKAQL